MTNAAIGSGLLAIFLHWLLGKTKGVELTSHLLVLIGAIYFGFALLSHNKKATVSEVIVVSLFVMMAVLGLWILPWVLIAEFFLHGFWDIAHHNQITYL